MLRFHQGWNDIMAMNEPDFWRLSAIADEISIQEEKAARKAKRKSSRRR